MKLWSVALPQKKVSSSGDTTVDWKKIFCEAVAEEECRLRYRPLKQRHCKLFVRKEEA